MMEFLYAVYPLGFDEKCVLFIIALNGNADIPEGSADAVISIHTLTRSISTWHSFFQCVTKMAARAPFLIITMFVMPAGGRPEG